MSILLPLLLFTISHIIVFSIRLQHESTIRSELQLTAVEFGGDGEVELYINGKFVQKSVFGQAARLTASLPKASSFSLRAFGGGTVYFRVRGRGNLFSSTMPESFHAISQLSIPVSSEWPTSSYNRIACAWPLSKSVSPAGLIPVVLNTNPIWVKGSDSGSTVLIRNMPNGCSLSESKNMDVGMKQTPDKNAILLASAIINELRRELYPTGSEALEIIVLDKLESVKSQTDLRLEDLFGQLPTQLPVQFSTGIFMQSAMKWPHEPSTESSVQTYVQSHRKSLNHSRRNIISHHYKSTKRFPAVKMDCFSEKCGTQVKVKSEAGLRKDIVMKAVNVLRRRPSFEDVYDMVDVVVTKDSAPKIYAVFVPFRETYISEFR